MTTVSSSPTPIIEARPEPEPAVPRLEFLDGLRGAAALFVFIHHAWLTVWPIYDHHLPTGITRTLTIWMIFGHFAVSIFIVISGFSLMLSVERNKGVLRGRALYFLKKRAHRILPPYYAAMFLSLLLIWTLIGKQTGTHWDGCVPVSKRGFITHLLLVNDLFKDGSINHVFWSIAVEWHIYFCFPLLVLVWNRIGVVRGVIAVILVAYAAHWLIASTRLNGLVVHFLALFGLGMFGAVVAFTPNLPWRHLRERFAWKTTAALCTLMVIILCQWWGWWKIYMTTDRGAYIDLIVGIAAMYIMISVSNSPFGRMGRFLALRPLTFLGTISYSLYLIHAPLLQVVWQYLIHPLAFSNFATFLLVATIGGGIIVGLSWLFFLSCERPFMNKPRSDKPRSDNPRSDNPRSGKPPTGSISTLTLGADGNLL